MLPTGRSTSTVEHGGVAGARSVQTWQWFQWFCFLINVCSSLRSLLCFLKECKPKKYRGIWAIFMHKMIEWIIVINNRDLNFDQNNRDYDFGHNRAALPFTLEDKRLLMCLAASSYIHHRETQTYLTQHHVVTQRERERFNTHTHSSVVVC